MSELDHTEQEKALQNSIIDLEYTGGSIGGLHESQADFKIYHDLAYKIRDFKLHFENIKNTWADLAILDRNNGCVMLIENRI